MTQRHRLAWFLVGFLGLVIAMGCGSSQPRTVPVSGTVKVDGQPLADGFMYFRTIETGALERFDIKGGQFQGRAQLGPRRVEICANRPRMMIIDNVPVEVQENIIHPSFNVASTLTAQVTSEGPNCFTFEVTLK